MEEGTRYSTIVKWKFFTALLTGFLLLGGMAATFGVTSTAFGLPIGGMGDFHVKFDRLEGTGFVLDTNLERQGRDDVTPLVKNEIQGATVHGLHMFKELNLPIIGWVRLNVNASEPTMIQGLVQEARFIEADIQMKNLGISENDFTQILEGGSLWSQRADMVSITDAEIVTDYLFQDIVSLKGMNFSVERIESPKQVVSSTVGSNRTNSNSGNISFIENLLPNMTGYYTFIILGVALSMIVIFIIYKKTAFRRSLL